MAIKQQKRYIFNEHHKSFKKIYGCLEYMISRDTFVYFWMKKFEYATMLEIRNNAKIIPDLLTDWKEESKGIPGIADITRDFRALKRQIVRPAESVLFSN